MDDSESDDEFVAYALPKDTHTEQQVNATQQILNLYHDPYTGYRPVKRFFEENKDLFETGLGYTFNDVREVLQLHSPIYNTRSKNLKMQLHDNPKNTAPFRMFHMDLFFMLRGTKELTQDKPDKSSKPIKETSKKLPETKKHGITAAVIVDVTTRYTYARVIPDKTKKSVKNFLKKFYTKHPEALETTEGIIGDGESAWRNLTFEDVLPGELKRKMFIPSSSKNGAYLAESAIGQIKKLYRDMLLVRKFNGKQKSQLENYELNDTTLESICHIINNRNGSLAKVDHKNPQAVIDEVLFPNDKKLYRVFSIGDIVHVVNDVHTTFAKKSLTQKFTDVGFEILSYSYDLKTGKVYYKVRSLGSKGRFMLHRNWAEDQLMHVAAEDIENDSHLQAYKGLPSLFWQRNVRMYY